MYIDPSLMVFLAKAAIGILTNVLGYGQERKLGRNLKILGGFLLLPSDCGFLQNHAGSH